MTKQPVARKKLIEVSIPLEAINAASEPVKKKAPKGYFTGVQKYWSQKPLPASRGILFAQLVDDPSSCPEEFPTKAEQDAERGRLHKIIEGIVPWEATQKEDLQHAARYEIARSVARGRGEKLPPLAQMRPQQIVDYLQENAPPVYDPFSGGGSIPLEAQRLGLKAMGSDLNPVAVLIGKALIEFPPKFAARRPVNPDRNELHQWKGAQGLADDVRYYGRWMREQAEKKIGHFYPKVTLADGKTQVTAVAWLWARTVPSPDPRARGAHVPLASSFVLSAKEGREVIVQPVVDRAKMEWRFEIDDKPSADALKAAKNGTKAARGAKFTCLLTGTAIDDTHVKAEAMAGRMGAALMAIVAEGNRNRVYLAPTPQHVTAAASAKPPDVPEVDQPLPNDPRNFWTVSYGLDTFLKLFTPRQLVALTTFSDLVMMAREKALADAKADWSGKHADDTRPLADGGLGPVAYADAAAIYLSLVLGRMVGYSSAITTWLPKDSALRHAIPRQAIQMMWETAEANPFTSSSGDFDTCTRAITAYLNQCNCNTPGSVEMADASDARPPTGMTVCTDPPYYNNIGYADLTDFFYVWHRRTLSLVLPELFRRVLTPKSNELVVNPYRQGGMESADAQFMKGMTQVLTNLAAHVGTGPRMPWGRWFDGRGLRFWLGRKGRLRGLWCKVDLHVARHEQIVGIVKWQSPDRGG